MVILGINTALKTPVIALINGEAFFETELGSEQNKTEELVPKIHKLLSKAKVDIADLSQIVVVSGPGSFTALRIFRCKKAGCHEQRIPREKESDQKASLGEDDDKKAKIAAPDDDFFE